MLIRIDPTREEPVFAQLAASIRADAAAGRISPGERLPAAREIAAALGVNPHTVLHAYQQLRDEGLVDIRRGRGAVVTDAVLPLSAMRQDVADLVARASELGIARESLVAMIRDATPPESDTPIERSAT